MGVKYLVRDAEDYGYEPLPIEASSPSRAAEEACEHWRRHSRWTGGAPPDSSIDLIVAEVATGIETAVAVEVRMEVGFYGHIKRKR
jgi:hypothetical protein